MKTLLILLVLGVGIVAIFIYSGGNSDVDTSEVDQSPVVEQEENVTKPVDIEVDTSREAHTILFTSEGTQPKDLDIKIGDSVTFVNQSDIRHWPASDVHPVHTLCPGFDAVGGLQPTESYTHVFDEGAVCTYHDHLRAGDRRFNGEIRIQ